MTSPSPGYGKGHDKQTLEATAGTRSPVVGGAPLVAGRSNSEKRRRLWLGLEQLGRLVRGWDTYDGPPIDKRALAKAHDIGMALIPSEESFHLVPCSDGGVQIEWHRDDFDVEIYIAAVTPSLQDTSSQEVAAND